MKTHVVKLKANRKTLSAYLKEDMNLSSRKAKKLLKDGIAVNNKKAYGDMKLKDGDILYIEEDKSRDNILPEKMEISVLYEDEHILAVNKPPYMVIHPTKTHMEGTLANGIRFYFDERGIEEPVRFFNRIDMNTSGIVLIAKSSQAHSLLDRYSAKTMEKKYIAIVSGHIEKKEGRISLPISNEADQEGRRNISDQGSLAITDYKVLEEFESSSLISVSIITGKTHQIRVHFSSIGNPLLGDRLYGGENDMIDRQALHASELNFLHPIYKKPISIKADLPNDMLLLLKMLKGEA
ncbi:RluA family pseudouridine synthase [Lutispora thermophila]|uniref:Pseudouridine synthase n=1 Tax=Lutispora thermophila DSM 19022 TaxID=1122184 RepID=A0A1M6CHV6_9FIRM|nr:RluA family pseudouridine synthase [Lutispora thermophila]SHI60615.1 23S rRNA pseudouridine1911/1915/1917 synthase [Lutispora thermophila DSM 19022]